MGRLHAHLIPDTTCKNGAPSGASFFEKERAELKNWEAELPAGYREAFVIDAKNDKKLLLWMNLIVIVVMAVFIAAGFAWLRPFEHFESFSIGAMLWFLAAMIAYVVLHELVHGAAYKALTGQKLTFGLTLTVAFCGVPEIYVYRKASLIAVLAPFVVFTVVFLLALAILPGAWPKFLCLLLLGLHVGGCVGDLYNTALYLTRFRDPRTLTRDTGPIQTFYIPDDM